MSDIKSHIPVVQDPLLVSCPGGKGGVLYVFGQQHIMLSTIATTGIHLDDKRLVIAYQVNGGSKIKVVDHKSFSEVELSDKPLDLHDVLMYEDSLYAVATENNEVIQFDKMMNVVSRWGLPGEHDSSHMNSVAVYQGRLIVSFFGPFEKNREYKEGTEKLGQVIDIKTKEIMINGLSQPHSLTVDGEYLYLCSSQERELHRYYGYKLNKKISLPGYTRGLALGDKHIYVGISQSRNIMIEDDCASGSIVILNRETLETVGVIMIPFTEVYDIRLVNDRTNLVLKTVSINEEAVKIHEQTKQAYEQTKQAYEHTRQAYEQMVESVQKGSLSMRNIRGLLRIQK